MNEMLKRVADAIDNVPSQIDVAAQRLAEARAAITAMREPSEVQWSGLARDIVQWCRFSEPTGLSLYAHLSALGHQIPQWLFKEIPENPHVPQKGTVAACIYKAMIDEVLK